MVGYCGGMEDNPTYKNILDYTEAILVEFDPNVVGYHDVLMEWSKIISDKLGPSPRQYRFAAWYLNDRQQEIAKKVVTEILEKDDGSSADASYVVAEAATRFYRAEEYHQHFLTSNAARMKCFFQYILAGT